MKRTRDLGEGFTDAEQAASMTCSTRRASAPLNALRDGAGHAVRAQYGSWDRPPVSDASPEIITVARR